MTDPHASPSQQPIRLPLTQLKAGDRAMMASTSISAEDREILRAMGLDERCEFKVCRAGGSGPCIIQFDGSRLGLSPELARRILTRPCDCPEAGCCAADASSTATPTPTAPPPRA